MLVIQEPASVNQTHWGDFAVTPFLVRCLGPLLACLQVLKGFPALLLSQLISPCSTQLHLAKSGIA